MRVSTYEIATPDEETADGGEDDSHDKQRRDDSARDEKRVPCPQSLLLEWSI